MKIFQPIVILLISFIILSSSCREEIEGCIDPIACNYDEDASLDNGTCWYENTSCSCEYPADCENVCGGDAVEDGCGVCSGGATNIGNSWLMKIEVIASIKKQVGTDMGSDTSSTIIGASMHALDGWNVYEGGCPNGGNDNICFSDLIYNDINPNTNYIKFYFPHSDWEDDIPTSYNTTDIRQDIQYNDLDKLFSNGMTWTSVLGTEPSENLVDSLVIKFTYLYNITNASIEVDVNGKRYNVNNLENILNLEINSDSLIPITFRVYDICFE